MAIGDQLREASPVVGTVSSTDQLNLCLDDEGHTYRSSKGEVLRVEKTSEMSTAKRIRLSISILPLILSRIDAGIGASVPATQSEQDRGDVKHQPINIAIL